MRTILSLFAVFVISLGFFPSTAFADKKVPDLVGLTASDANTELEDLGLVLGGPKETLSMREVGTVVSTEPPAGTRVENGSIVTISLSKGIWIPDYVGQDGSLALQELDSLGFDVADREVIQKPISEGIVASQTPTPSTLFDASKMQVILFISTGPTAIVPSVVGKKVGAARSEIEKVGLKNRITSGPQKGGSYPWGCGGDKFPGMCVSCSFAAVVHKAAPPTGSKLWPGDTVTLQTTRKGGDCDSAPGTCTPGGGCTLH